jgi:P-type Cu+ transporter
VNILMEGKENLMEIDPVCGMEVDPKSAAGSYEYGGKTYYFCSTGCLEDFKEDPGSYIG